MTNAFEYGKALFLLCEEDGRAEKVREDVYVLKGVFGENPQLTRLLDTPAVTKEEKLDVIDKAFSSLDEYLVNMLKILCERQSVHLLSSALDSFCALYDEARGIERVEAISAVAMTPSQIDRLRERLEEKTGKHIIVKNTVEPSILGGMKIRYMGMQLDGTVRTRLDSFERALSEIII